MLVAGIEVRDVLISSTIQYIYGNIGDGGDGMNSSLAKGFSCSGYTLISLHLLDISGVIPWPDVWYLDISLGETGTGCFA